MVVKKVVDGDKIHLSFAGKIDEDADFTDADIQGAQKLEIDLDGIQTINSVGIREWIKWIRNAPSSTEIIYEKCPKVIVDQINMVEGFLPAGAKVQSFYVPYYNEDTGSEKSVLFIDGQHFSQGQFKPPTEVTDDAGNPMEIDVIESKYFKFLEKLK